MPPRRLVEPPFCRCQALNKAGRPCGITSASQALDSSGCLAAGPLLRGGSRCSFHARWFCTAPLEGPLATPPLVIYVDLETTGLSLATDEIVEIGILADASRAAFSTVVRPSALPLDAGIHGISPEELLDGPPFEEAFKRMATFLDKLACSALSDDDGSSSDEDGSELPRLRSAVPSVLLAAHNGVCFDFGMLFSQCWRCGVPATLFETWLYVDTLDVLKAVGESGACLKLQCLRTKCDISVGARAHRALDDCVVLAAVVQGLAASLGLQPWELLARFALKLDLATTCAELSSLL